MKLSLPDSLMRIFIAQSRVKFPHIPFEISIGKYVCNKYVSIAGRRDLPRSSELANVASAAKGAKNIYIYLVYNFKLFN